MKSKWKLLNSGPCVFRSQLSLSLPFTRSESFRDELTRQEENESVGDGGKWWRKKKRKKRRGKKELGGRKKKRESIKSGISLSVSRCPSWSSCCVSGIIIIMREGEKAEEDSSWWKSRGDQVTIDPWCTFIAPFLSSLRAFFHSLVFLKPSYLSDFRSRFLDSCLFSLPLFSLSLSFRPLLLSKNRMVGVKVERFIRREKIMRWGARKRGREEREMIRWTGYTYTHPFKENSNAKKERRKVTWMLPVVLKVPDYEQQTECGRMCESQFNVRDKKRVGIGVGIQNRVKREWEKAWKKKEQIERRVSKPTDDMREDELLRHQHNSLAHSRVLTHNGRENQTRFDCIKGGERV